MMHATLAPGLSETPMQHQLATGVLGVVAVLGTLALVPRLTAPRLTAPRLTAPRVAPITGPTGHLILLIEGDARGLRVSHITAKKAPYNPVRGAQTPYAVVVHDGNHKVLGRYPLDLSHFDLDAKNVGKPVRVQGCELIDTKVAMLTNIPWFPNASFLEIKKIGVSVGELLPDNYQRLVEQGTDR